MASDRGPNGAADRPTRAHRTTATASDAVNSAPSTSAAYRRCPHPAVPPATACDCDALACSISTRASPMSRRRRLGSLSKHRLRIRRTRRRRVLRQSRPVGLMLQHLGDDVGCRPTVEHHSPGQHLVEDAAERPDVGARVDRQPARLLGTHVRGRAEDHAGASSRRGDGGLSSGPGRISLERLCQAEIEHLDEAIRATFDVGRLQVAMDDAFLVRSLERARQSAPRRRAPQPQAVLGCPARRCIRSTSHRRPAP